MAYVDSVAYKCQHCPQVQLVLIRDKAKHDVHYAHVAAITQVLVKSRIAWYVCHQLKACRPDQFILTVHKLKYLVRGSGFPYADKQYYCSMQSILSLVIFTNAISAS